MTKKMVKSSVRPRPSCVTSVALGQVANSPAVSDSATTFTPVLLEPKAVDMNHISMGFQPGFNLKTSFKHIGKFGAGTNPGSTRGLSDRFYDYVYSGDVDGAIMGAQFRGVGSYGHRNHLTGESAVLDLSQSVFFTSGVGNLF